MLTRDLESKFLAALLGAEGGFVSGSEMAKRFGLTRVSIWARCEKLRKRGFEVEAIRNRGYRLVAMPESLDPAALGAHLIYRGLGESLHAYFEENVDSTNSVVERLLTQGTSDPLLVLAKEQSGGRGRQGRCWASDGGSLMFSLGFRPAIEPSKMALFPLWAGVKLCQKLRELYGLSLKVKWPNDLLIDGKKLAGILMEARVERDVTRDLIFGLGMNVSTNLSEELAHRAVSLAQASGRLIDMNVLAVELIDTCLRAFESFVKTNVDEELQGLWNEFDGLRGKEISASSRHGVVQGTSCGIDSDGGLLICDRGGAVHSVRSGEVSLTHNLSE